MLEPDASRAGEKSLSPILILASRVLTLPASDLGRKKTYSSFNMALQPLTKLACLNPKIPQRQYEDWASGGIASGMAPSSARPSRFGETSAGGLRRRGRLTTPDPQAPMSPARCGCCFSMCLSLKEAVQSRDAVECCFVCYASHHCIALLC
jgi:hypothetical protein